jgi:hypothetical protein
MDGASLLLPPSPTRGWEDGVAAAVVHHNVESEALTAGHAPGAVVGTLVVLRDLCGTGAYMEHMCVCVLSVCPAVCYASSHVHRHVCSSPDGYCVCLPVPLFTRLPDE